MRLKQLWDLPRLNEALRDGRYHYIESIMSEEGTRVFLDHVLVYDSAEPSFLTDRDPGDETS